MKKPVYIEFDTKATGDEPAFTLYYDSGCVKYVTDDYRLIVRQSIEHVGYVPLDASETEPLEMARVRYAKRENNLRNATKRWLATRA